LRSYNFAVGSLGVEYQIGVLVASQYCSTALKVWLAIWIKKHSPGLTYADS